MADILATLSNVTDFVNNFSKYILTPVMNQFSYLYSYNGNIQRLRDEVERLNKKTSDLQLAIRAAERNTHIITSGAKEWIKEAEKITEKEKEIMEYKAEAEKGCFYGIFPNIKQRYSVSRKAKKTTEAACGLLKNEGIFNNISYPAPLESIPLETSSVSEIESRKSKEDEIMAALNDNNVYVIALCGMGGVGKTTMTKIIKNKVKEGKLFEAVAMVTVSQTPNLKEIQQGIAEGVDFVGFNEQTKETRAERLHMRLKAMKSILIILDDVWEKLDLREIGIPSKVDHQRCKIILTSRKQNVCERFDTSAKIIQLNVLSEQESWNLFKKIAGEIVDKETLHPIAREVAKECNGLPLALEVVAAAMRNSSLSSWKDALHLLKLSNAEEIPEVRDRVYVPLKWSYEQIGNEEARYLFLLCCLFPEDYEIPLYALVDYVFNLPNFANTSNLEEARNRVYRLVERLIDHFLLIRVELSENRDTGDENYMEYRVKMHDVIRDMGISLASKARHIFMAVHDPNLREWPTKDSDYGNCTCISLKSSTNLTLLENIHCPSLELLYVVSPDLEVQEGCFDRMQKLRILRISFLQSLPSSLSWAKKLRSLNLVGYKFKYIPNEIGECVNLEILNLRSSYIETLPEEIGKLRNLKLFNLQWCNYLKKIPQGALSRLVQLEELYMNLFDYWSVGDNGNANVDEVLSLKNLTTLQLRASILSINTLLQEYENLNKFLRYYVEIREQELVYVYPGNVDRYVHIESIEHFSSMDKIQVLFDNAQAIVLFGSGTTHIANKLSRHGYKTVERLTLLGLDLEFLFDSNSYWNLPNITYFPCLTTLHISSNKLLKEICNGQPPNGSFSNLTSITVEDCNVLNHLFSFSFVPLVTNLESLEIAFCSTIEDLFIERNKQDYKDNNTIILPRLSKIILFSLSSLEALFRANEEDITIILPKLCEVEIVECSRLKSFRIIESCSVPIPTDGQENESEQKQYFIDPKVMFSVLKKLKLHKSWNNEIFDPRIPSDNLTNLESLDISGPNSCVSVFSNSISRAMFSLKKLYISRFDLLQEGIAKEKEEQTRSEVVILFPQLKELRLRELPKMIQVFHGSDLGIYLPSLENLEIRSSKLMERFCRTSSQQSDSNIMVEDRSFFDEVTCFKLKELHLSNLEAVNRIFGRKIRFGNFRSLQRIYMEDCNMRSIFSLRMFKGLVNLEVIDVRNCSNLEEVIPKEDTNPLFPKLERVWLQNLPNIVEFCHTMTNLDFPSLVELTFMACPKLRRFCTIQTEIHPKEEQTFFHQKVGSLLRLEVLSINECNGFINLFPNFIYVEERISYLNVLEISTCEMLQEVIGKKDDEEEQSHSRISLFPMLKQLTLRNLPNIKTFCDLNSNIEFPSLEELTIDNCKLMETFFGGSRNFLSTSQMLDSKSFFTKVSCRELRYINFVSVNGAAEELFGRKVSVANFSGLKCLEISQCERLKSIFSATMFRGLVHLYWLQVRECPKVKEIISMDEKEVEETIPTKAREIIFPKLEYLFLADLPKLVRICHIKNDLELPSLSELSLSCCYGLESFSIGSVHLPSSAQISANNLGSIEGKLSNEVFLTKFNLSLSDKRGNE